MRKAAPLLFSLRYKIKPKFFLPTFYHQCTSLLYVPWFYQLKSAEVGYLVGVANVLSVELPTVSNYFFSPHLSRVLYQQFSHCLGQYFVKFFFFSERINQRELASKS
jgi:hypothetical protein